MKKIVLSLSLFLLFAIAGTAQKGRTVFIEIRGGVDALGNISLDRIEASKKIRLSLDTLFNFKELQLEIIRLQNPTAVMGMMTERGWKFCSAMQVNKDESGRPASTFIAYYFSKEFEPKHP